MAVFAYIRVATADQLSTADQLQLIRDHAAQRGIPVEFAENDNHDLNRPAQCRDCGGKGRYPCYPNDERWNVPRWKKCKTCKGTGLVEPERRS